MGKTLEKEELTKLAHEMGDLKIGYDIAPVRVCGKVAYAEQKAWIENKTIKDTILFGEPLDEERYQATIKACQLVDDLKQLAAGDKTQLGEKGINLSGG